MGSGGTELRKLCWASYNKKSTALTVTARRASALRRPGLVRIAALSNSSSITVLQINGELGMGGVSATSSSAPAASWGVNPSRRDQDVPHPFPVSCRGVEV